MVIRASPSHFRQFSVKHEGEFWKSVLWSDESKLKLFKDGCCFSLVKGGRGRGLQASQTLWWEHNAVGLHQTQGQVFRCVGKKKSR